MEVFSILLAGWGKDAKEIAYLGVLKCPNCKNHSHFYLLEISSKATLYFIPVAKFNKKSYLACEICNQFWEINEKTKSEMLIENIKNPSKELFIKIWEEVDSIINNHFSDKEVTPEELGKLIEQIPEKLKGTFTERHIEVVLSTYIEYLADTDKPR